MTELLPCPFCGGEAETHEVWFPYHYWDVWCDGECFDHFCEKPTEAEAIAAWNTRYHSEFEETVIKAWKEIKDYTERTCSVAASYSPSDMNEIAEWYFAFSCGCELYWDEQEPPNYCPNCGARVIKSDQ